MIRPDVTKAFQLLSSKSLKSQINCLIDNRKIKPKKKTEMFAVRILINSVVKPYELISQFWARGCFRHLSV